MKGREHFARVVVAASGILAILATGDYRVDPEPDATTGLRLVNQSQSTVGYFHVSSVPALGPIESGNWGLNRLGNTVVSPGNSFVAELVCGSFDYKVRVANTDNQRIYEDGRFRPTCGQITDLPITSTAITGDGEPQIAASGCHRSAYNGFANQEFGCGLVSSLGSLALDQAFQQESELQRQFFSDSAAVLPFSECDVSMANALSRPDDVILFGYYLTQKIISDFNDTLPLAVIMAHEFGHQLQFTNGWMDRGENTVRNTELEADAWAGLYIALKKPNISEQSLHAALAQIIDIGDYNFNDPSHHGTPAERGTMFVIGFQVALEYLQAIQQRMQPSFADLHARIEYYRGVRVGQSLPDNLNKHFEFGVDPRMSSFLMRIRSGEATYKDYSLPADWSDMVERATLAQKNAIGSTLTKKAKPDRAFPIL